MIVQTNSKSTLEQELEEIKKRNEERAKETIMKMGEKWLLHPKHRVPLNKKDSILYGR